MDERIKEIPIFPLHTVLFPGMPIHLHIFEERYKNMVQVCLEKGSTFGVVMIRNGKEALGPVADPHEIGCTAKISSVEPLSEGRLNLTAFGDKRFKIHHLCHKKEYLRGEIEILPDVCPCTPDKVYMAALELLGLFQACARIQTGREFPESKLPCEPNTLAYLAATLLPVPSCNKQHLLSIQNTYDLIKELIQTYKRQVSLLHQIRNQGQTQDPHSMN